MRSTPPARRLSWPFPIVLIPFWYAWVAWGWWKAIIGGMREASASVPAAEAAFSIEAAAATALLARVLGSLSEAALYTLWWKSRGARLPYWRFLFWIVGLSVLDLVGLSLRHTAADASAAVRAVCAALAGPAALDEAAPTGFAAAFGGLGLLTLARVGLTGWAQARAIGRPLAGPLALTACAWMTSRFVGWWSFDLIRGMSPVP